MEVTYWNVFFKGCDNNIDFLTDSLTSYLQFCTESFIPTKTVKVYSNKKPWITKDLKQALIQNKYAFLQGNQNELNSMNKELRCKIRGGEREYKRKVEEKLSCGNAQEAWKGLNLMMGRMQEKQSIQHNDPIKFAN